MDETPPPELDAVEKIQRILQIPGAKLLMMMSCMLGGIIGILILYAWLAAQHGMPVQIDCKTALAACKNALP